MAAIQVVPEQQTAGQQFAGALATGLGKGAANLATQGIGAGLGALGTGLGRLTGLVPKRGLSKEMLSKAGFKDADIDILLSMPEKDQIKMMELILSRAPEESSFAEATADKVPSEEPQAAPRGAPEALTDVPQTPQENAEESQPISSAFMQDYKEFTGRDFQSTLPGAQQAVTHPEKPKASALFRPSMQQKKQQEATERAKRDLEIKEEKLKFQKEQAEKAEKREMTKEERKEQHYVDAQTKPFFEKTNVDAKEAKKSSTRLDRMETLVKKGNIRHPFWNTLFNTVSSGIFGPHGPKVDLHFLQNADTQEFNKLSKDFLKGAKAVFGSRVTEGEIKLFLETVPSLSLNDEGKMRVINNLRSLNDAALAEKNAMDDIIEEHGGKRPSNLENLVAKRSKKEIDRLAEQFKSGIRS